MNQPVTVSDPDRVLMLLHVPSVHRAGVTALFALDERLARIVGGTREPMLAAIRLAWWRERLEALGRERVPEEPLLQVLATEVVDRGVAGAALEGIVEGWEALADESAGEAHGIRGKALFGAAARLLGGETTEEVRSAGAGWALVDLAFHDSVRARGEAALAAGRERLAGGPARWPRQLRSLGMLAVLARRDAAAGLDRARVPGSPQRAARMIAHRLSGR